MKKLLLLVVLLLILCSCLCKSRNYGGRVIEKYKTTAGYKIHEEKHVVFYNDSIKRNIDVKVNDNTYANCSIDSYVSFKLCTHQID